METDWAIQYAFVELKLPNIPLALGYGNSSTNQVLMTLQVLYTIDSEVVILGVEPNGRAAYFVMPSWLTIS